MKRNIKRLPALLLVVILCLSLLPVTASAAFPSKFYAALMNVSGMGTVNSYLNYTSKNTEAQQVYGMEYAGGVFFTVVGKKEDDGWRELRMYNSNLTNSRTIGDVTNQSGTVQYAIVDTAMDISGAEPVLYGTYQALGMMGENIGYYSYICQIDLTSGVTSNWKMVTGLESEENDIIYAIAFDKDGTLYAIGADKADDGGPASLYTIDLDTGAATLVGAIMTGSGSAVSTNYLQDLAFDHAQNTLYWAENAENDLYTLNTTDAMATKVGQVKSSGKVYPIQSFCIPYDTAFGQADDQYMISVICEGAGEVTCNDENKPFYLVNSGEDITLTIEFNTGGVDDNLLGVTVDGKTVSISSLVDNSYTFENVTGNHVIEVKLKKEIPATQNTVTWLHYQGEPASFYTVDNVYKFYDLPYLDKEVPREDYFQTLLDEEGKPIDDDEIILPGSYDVHVTHPGNADYAAMDVIYTDALVLGKCPGTPGRPVVYGKVGCKQGDLTTTSALQDYYGSDGKLIDAAHDEIPVTLEWLEPETRYDTAGNFYASATIHAAKELDQRLKDCYDLDDEGTPLTEGCLISARNTQVVVLPADEASLIKVQASDASGGTVSGKGVYKNGDTVTVTATVNENDGYTFGGWQENGQIISGADATYTFNASGDRTLTALFEVKDDYRVILKTDPTDAGTVTGGGSYEDEPHEATVEATANQGYYFIGWYEGETLKSEQAEYSFEVTEDGATLTAKFDIDYLARAEMAKTNFASAVSTSAFEWQTLMQAVEAYEAAADFVENPPSAVTDAETRYAALTTYYQSITTLNLSNQNLSSGDLAKLALFTGVTDLNLSGNKDITDLTSLKNLTALETLDISNTGMTVLDSLIPEGQSTFPGYQTLTAQNLSLTSLSALAELVGAEGFEAGSVIKWDFTGSTLPPKDENRDDVKAIQEKLSDEQFIPPTIPKNTYIISASPATLDFGSVYPNYTQPAARTVTIKNTGNQTVTVTLPTSTNYIITAGTGFTNGSSSINPNGTATFTVQPKAGLAVGTYSENITVSGAGGATVTITANFTVKQYSSGGGTPTKTPSQQAVDKIESAKDGSTVEIKLSTGSTKLDKEVFEELAGRDVTLEISLSNGVTWTVNGQDIPGNADLTDLDMGVSLNTSTIPVNLINSVTGEAGTVQLTLKHNGEFGFKMMLTAPVGVKNSGLWANLYHYDEDAGKMVYQAAALVDEDGNVALPFDHASQYALVLDSKSHDLPFTDLAADAWYTDAVAYVYRHDLMAGYGENLFGPDDHLSRAQLCQILYNKEGRPAVTGNSAFIDITDGAWYSGAVTWAAKSGIVGGYGNGLFGPEDNITREQLAAILYRYAQAKGYDTASGADLSAYGDASDVSSWAIPAMQWACGTGVIMGVTESTLLPQGSATRAQVATMLMRFCEYYADTK